MPQHRFTCTKLVSCCDLSADLLVILERKGEVLFLQQQLLPALDHESAQIVENGEKENIPGRGGNRSVKFEVSFQKRLGVSEANFLLSQDRVDVGQIIVRGSLGRQAGQLDFERF